MPRKETAVDLIPFPPHHLLAPNSSIQATILLAPLIHLSLWLRLRMLENAFSQPQAEVKYFGTIIAHRFPLWHILFSFPEARESIVSFFQMLETCHSVILSFLACPLISRVRCAAVDGRMARPHSADGVCLSAPCRSHFSSHELCWPDWKIRCGQRSIPPFWNALSRTPRSPPSPSLLIPFLG